MGTALSRRLQAARPDDISPQDWALAANECVYFGDDRQQYALEIEYKRQAMIHDGEQYRRKHGMPVAKYDSGGEIVIPPAGGDRGDAVKGVGIGAFIALLAVIVTAGSIALVVFVATADIKFTFNFDPLFAGVLFLLGILAGLPFVLLAMASGRPRY